ncbi:MAG: nuclear transport factor 2 family protein [Candidatus Neomarinimicrobiota bacterium]
MIRNINFLPHLTLLVSAGMLLGRCAAPVDVAAETARLLQTDREFSLYSVETNAAEAFRHYLDRESLQLPHLSAPIFGRDAIYEGMVGDTYQLSWEPVAGEVAESGDLGWTWGNYELRFEDDDGQPVARHGKYLNVWRLQPDDSWKVIVDMGNSNPPMD